MTEPVPPSAIPVIPPAYPANWAYPPYVPGQAGPPHPAYPLRPIPVAPGGVPLADVWARFVAYIVDSFLLMFVNLIPIAAVLVILFGRFRSALDEMQHQNQVALATSQVPNTGPVLWHLFLLELILIAIAIPLMVLFSYLYYVEFSYRSGQTIGKKIMKITVVRAADSGPVTKRIMRRRWIVLHVAALFAPYFSYADSLWLLWDKPFQQCLHDKCADTVVVKSRP